MTEYTLNEEITNNIWIKYNILIFLSNKAKKDILPIPSIVVMEKIDEERLFPL